MSILPYKWISLMLRKSKPKLSRIHLERIPTHVAIIMDGNGRWAKQKGLPRIAGHHSGMKNIKNITIAAHQIGVKVLTLYAFSTENWKRPQDEIDFLMKLPQEFLKLELDELMENQVKVTMTGWKHGLPLDTLNAIEQAIDKTKDNLGIVLNIAINYGSRKEIIHGIKLLVNEVNSGKLLESDINEDVFSKFMLTSDYPDPDLLIRTSGELRLSNFLLWQLAYSELWFTDKLWPDFDEKIFMEAILEYQHRARRYGGV
jgi:undecaprenyl diphosphate synthase